MPQTIYLGFCLLVGLCAIGRGGGFFLWFILAIFLTPLLTLIALLIAVPAVVDLNGKAVKSRK